MVILGIVNLQSLCMLKKYSKEGWQDLGPGQVLPPASLVSPSTPHLFTP